MQYVPLIFFREKGDSIHSFQDLYSKRFHLLWWKSLSISCFDPELTCCSVLRIVFNVLKLLASVFTCGFAKLLFTFKNHEENGCDIKKYR